uniref:Zn(2)-C6 fungal-type domain-containing protein n=1 Tax=Kalmanozyma brasiliensis (strain GHG001) TaxID=1365824 RepID=V5EXK0_KALBG
MSPQSSTSSPFVMAGGDPSKRSVDDARLESDAQLAAKRKRPQSCDTCRSRKIKCVRLPVDGPDAAADSRCVQCRAIDAKCTFDYIPKRPGPQSSFAKTARREAEAQAKASSHAHSAATPSSRSQASTAAVAANTPSSRFGGPSPHSQQDASTHSPADDSWYRELAAQNIPSNIDAGQQTRSSSFGGVTNFDAYLNNSMLAMTPGQFPGMPGASPFDMSTPNLANLSGPSPSMSMSNASAATPGSYAGSSSWHGPPHTRVGSGAATTGSGRKGKDRAGHSTTACEPVLRPRSLEDIAPRQTFLAIVSLYFHYLWPLLPIVDRPTFSHDLLNRRDERDEAFLAFVLSLTSYTLIQCPRTVIPAPWSVYRRLHRICHLTSRQMQPRRYDPPQLLHVNTLYCDHIYLGTVGKVNAANAVLAEAVQVAFTLGLHDERKNDGGRSAAPYGLDASSFAHYRAPTANAVNNELRKRMFWVLHGSSTTIAMLQDGPALIHAIDACVDLPLAVTEEALADPGHPQRFSSVLSGFLTVTRLHQVMLELLESYRRDRRFPVDDLGVARSRIRYLADVLRRLQRAIDEMPEELRKPVYTHSPPEPVRRPGSALPTLDSVATPGQAPLLQAIGFDPATQTALGDHLSGSSSWPWPAETFSRDGLPNPADARSSSTPRSSGMPSTQRENDPNSGGLTMMDLVNVFRPSPPPESTPILSPMCTMHANIVTTESLIRFLVTEYRELISMRINELKLHHPSALTSAPEDIQGELWQDAAANMLRVFNSLPLDALASNGLSLIHKIVYVVTAMLARTGRGGLTAGYGYMSSLLATLTRLSQTRGEEAGEEGDDESVGGVEGADGGDDGPDAGAGGTGDRRNEGNTGGDNNGNGHGDDSRGGPNRDDSHRGNLDRSRSDTNHPPATERRFHTTLPLTLPDTAVHLPAAYNSHTPSSSTAHTDSTASSTVNTATTTPTSEHPGAGFYDKLLTRTNPVVTASQTQDKVHVRCSTEPTLPPGQGRGSTTVTQLA